MTKVIARGICLQCMLNREHIQWTEIKTEVLENVLNKFSRLVNAKKKIRSGISSSWRELVASSKIERCQSLLYLHGGSCSLLCCSRVTLLQFQWPNAPWWVRVALNLISFSDQLPVGTWRRHEWQHNDCRSYF